MQIRTILLAGSLSVAPSLLHAQFDFKLAERDVQVHTFASQGFACSNDNNYLTTKTSQGSLAMTDGGANVSMRISDKLRVAAQVYDRNLGQMGKWHPNLDFALVDYRVKDWLGFRAGRVKSAMGLYNDTQDMEFLHTWAIMPQSIYPTDLRASNLAHTGGDIYGTIAVKHLGSLAYTAYAGLRSKDSYGGYAYGLTSLGISETITGHNSGGDLHFNTPIPGVVVGTSYLAAPMHGTGTRYGTLPHEHESKKFNTTTFYAQYTKRNLRIDWEHGRTWHVENVNMAGTLYAVNEDHRSWYVAAAYRMSKRLEIGSYYSHYDVGVRYDGRAVAPWQDHEFDKVATARVDLTRWWHLKVEGHFIDGFSHPPVLRGFYPQQNPDGYLPKTNLLVIRTGVDF